MSFPYPVVTQTAPRARAAAVKAACRQGAAFVLLAPEGTRFTPQMLAALAARAAAAAPDVAALAVRVLPCGPQLHTDPVTLEAPMLRLDGVLLRCSALAAVGGLHPRLAGAQADADLCWRLRGAGHRLVYCPEITAACTREPAEPDLTAYVREVADSSLLYSRYGCPGAALQALLNTLRSPRHYPGVRKALLKALPAALLGVLGGMLAPADGRARALPRRNGALTAPGYGVMRGSCPITPAQLAAIAAENPLVSVVVRTCSRPDTLRQTLKCLRHQTYRNFEVVVVEDGPSTAQAMIAAEFADLPIRYHATGANVGRGRAGNLGIELAKGKYVSFLDDDDFYYPDFIQLHLAKLLTGERPGFVLSGTMALEATVLSRSPYEYRVERISPVLFDHITLMDMCVKCRVPMSGGMFLRSLYDVYGGMREDIDGDEDWAMWLRYWMAAGRKAAAPEIPRALSACIYPADPAVAAAREAAYRVYDEVMLGDPALQFVCGEEEIAHWQATVAADLAHLANVGGLEELLNEAKRHEAQPLPPREGSGPRTLTAKQINRYYWYLVQEKCG